MSEIDSFLTGDEDSVDAMFGTKSMVCNGQTFPVVWNDDRKSYEGALGGLESDVRAVAMAQATDVANPKAMLQKRCTVAGTAYRVAEVTAGDVAVSFTLADPNDSR